MKKAVWNRRYDGPVDRINFKKLKVGMRIYYEVIEWNRGGVPVTLEGTIIELKERGYARKASVKVQEKGSAGVQYLYTRQVLRILNS